MSSGEKILLTEAFFVQLWVGLLLKIVPFRWIPKMFADTNSREHAASARGRTQWGKGRGARRNPGGGDTVEQKLKSTEHGVQRRESLISDLQMIREAIRRASKVSPWKNRCLVSSLAARRMLRRRRIASRLSLGMAKSSDGRLRAHAWLEAGGYEIVPDNGNYHELYNF